MFFPNFKDEEIETRDLSDFLKDMRQWQMYAFILLWK